MATSVDYAELHCLSNFTFLRGASHAEELVARAAELGYCALAITDECSVAGIVRAHSAAQQAGLKLLVGAEFRLSAAAADNVRQLSRSEQCDDLRLVLLARHRAGYAQLCELITRARRAARKGEYRITRIDLEDGAPGCFAIWLPREPLRECELHWLRERFDAGLWIGIELHGGAGDAERLSVLQQLSLDTGVPAVACGDVHMHVRGRRALQDTLTAIRLRTTVAGAVASLYPNGERHLRSRQRLGSIYPREMLAASCEIAAGCEFSLDELRYEYPEELVPAGQTPASHLRALTEQGMRRRWPGVLPDKVRRMVEHELELIADMRYEQFFLTVHEIVCFARSRGILCQGRGSAANSAVCFSLGITEVDPSRMAMLFERFISRERNEPPDIDVDFEHERREEVIQHIYAKYGRERAALAATVICYRARSAVRDVGKALGLDALQVDRLTRALDMWEGEISDQRVRDGGFDPHSPVIARVLTLARELMGFPRHLSQHVGGFVISRGPLSSLVPVENATMPERTVIQWDKDDLDALGLLKVDVLGLGMLSAIRRSFDLIRDFDGRRFTLANVPAEDPRVYDMICSGDTMGVFQIESRAQMAMLPRLRPRSYYDLVIEVAIIRPGPIQGDMVHPYLRRRNGEEEVSYPSENVREVLSRTLGVPIFQEQVMELAMVAAGFTPGEADQLRRAMAAWRRRGGLGPFEDKLKHGMRERGYSEQFAAQIFRQIEGFGEYGFPESHAASFALLVYVSAWLKCHEPAVFCCALINSQPMGFYAPSQLVQDVRRHGVAVRAIDVLHSFRDCTLERDTAGKAVLRLGLRLVRGLSEAAAGRIVAARAQRAFVHVQDLTERAALDRFELGALAAAGALAALAGNRHVARWDVAGVEDPTPLMPQVEIREATPMLRRPTDGEDVIADYQSTGLTLGPHPMALLRAQLPQVTPAEHLWALPDGLAVDTAGLVITRQRPGTAKGVMFVTLEDETGCVNLIVWPKVAEQQRRVLLGARLLGVHGQLQRQGDVLHVIAGKLTDHSRLLGALPACSRDFH